MNQNEVFNVSLGGAPVASAHATGAQSLWRASILFALSLVGIIGASLLLASL